MPEPYVSIPETITVHLGAPSENAQNITVPFADYIKNVASSEIYPTWPEQAIRANVYAQISYVLNRVFTEWYRAQGYGLRHHQFHPLRPVFCARTRYFREHLHHRRRYDRHLPHPRRFHRAAVHAILQRHDRHLSGRAEPVGTVPLAEQGLSAEQILQSFYGSDINFVTGAPLSPNLGGSFPGVTLRLGDFSEGCPHSSRPASTAFRPILPEHPGRYIHGRRVQRRY